MSILFESQIGTRHVGSTAEQLVPLKYRWPVFELQALCR